jgi:hypothetical protein
VRVRRCLLRPCARYRERLRPALPRIAIQSPDRVFRARNSDIALTRPRVKGGTLVTRFWSFWPRVSPRSWNARGGARSVDRGRAPPGVRIDVEGVGVVVGSNSGAARAESCNFPLVAGRRGGRSAASHRPNSPQGVRDVRSMRGVRDWRRCPPKRRYFCRIEPFHFPFCYSRSLTEISQVR